jgi:ubiquinone/menaquinone biosynthesis C-methylase UbiE
MARMTNPIEDQVARHYARDRIEDAILAALAKSGVDIQRLTQSDLSAVDEFHTGGRQATSEFVPQTGFKAGMHLLDIGCGVGGPARYLAETLPCTVTGIDLTEDFVQTATALTRRVGLADRASFRQASALAMPFDAGSFDGAYMLHVGMNIEDKPELFAEVRNVLKPGGIFAIFDMMRAGPGDLAFPVPWAEGPATSFVASPADYRSELEAAGFEIVKERDRRDFALDFFRQAQEKAAPSGGSPPLSIHLLMSGDAKEKIANVIANLQAGRIAPTEMIAVAR